MRRLAGLLLALSLALPATAMAARKASAPVSGGGSMGHAGNFGLGLGLGDPTSITGKYFLDSTLALDFGLDFARGVAIHGDALWHLAELARGRDLSLQFYLGVGAQLGAPGYRRWYYDHYHSGGDLGLRVPIGLAAWLNRAPLEIFVELGPEIWIFHGYGSGFGSLGVRYYF